MTGDIILKFESPVLPGFHRNRSHFCRGKEVKRKYTLSSVEKTAPKKSISFIILIKKRSERCVKVSFINNVVIDYLALVTCI